VRRALPLAFVLGLSACLTPRAPAERLIDAAYDHNVAMRFGRMDIALDYVAAKVKDDWSRRHAAWGDRVRVVDLELAGMKLNNRDEAEVRVRIAWQRVDEAELRTSLLVQTWRDESSGWHLGAEKCASGDKTLLEEIEENGAERNPSVALDTVR